MKGFTKLKDLIFIKLKDLLIVVKQYRKYYYQNQKSNLKHSTLLLKSIK